MKPSAPASQTATTSSTVVAPARHGRLDDRMAHPEPLRQYGLVRHHPLLLPLAAIFSAWHGTIRGPTGAPRTALTLMISLVPAGVEPSGAGKSARSQPA